MFSRDFNKKCLIAAIAAGLAAGPGFAFAAYESRFDALNFTPSADTTAYFSLYGAQSLRPWQGSAGLTLDYANRPLRFTGTGGFAGANPSVITHMVTANAFGALGFTEWFSAGANLPAVLFNDFFADTPLAAPTGLSDSGASMGDITAFVKFRLLDPDAHGVGVAIIPTITLPTGDVTRYAGSGHVTGGGIIAGEFVPHERVRIAVNAGAVLRDRVVRHGADMNHQLTYGVGTNIHLGKGWHGIIEGYGSFVLTDFSSATAPLEVGGGLRRMFGTSGISLETAGYAGLRSGVGNPRFRALMGLRWNSPVREPCAPAPDPRIRGDRIIPMGKIYFDTDRASIKPVSYPVLDEVANTLNAHPEITLLEVQGHTDARASDEHNLRLSQARAESAAGYLAGKGIASGRLRAVGYGESRPVASNATDEGMGQNRRTEFVIIESSTGDIRSVAPPAGTTSPAPHSDGMPNYSYPPPSERQGE